jgi:dTDP-glucose 4,6-dehydratase
MTGHGFDPTAVLVTGGAGFIGSNFVRWLLHTSDEIRVINLDALTYAGNIESLSDVDEEFGPSGQGRYTFVHGDITDSPLVVRLISGEGPGTSPAPDAIINFAAESHVDRSILGPQPFIDTNILGTSVLLEALRSLCPWESRPFRFLHVSTDEVYGSLGASDPAFTECSPLQPNSPYAASKASADVLVNAYCKTYDLPAIITRCSNNYGPYQFPEKLVPLMITRAAQDLPLPVYGDGRNVRDWIHVLDHVEGLWSVLTKGATGQTFNIGGRMELTNVDMVTRVLRVLGKPDSLISFVADRPGHDRRYAMDIDHIEASTGWAPRIQFDDGLTDTVSWYLTRRSWWERIVNEAYRAANDLYLTRTARPSPS